MNIALSTLIIFSLILPGIIFRRFYYTGEFSSQYFKQSIFEVFASSLVPAFILHTIWYFATPILSDHTVDLTIFGYLFSSGDNLKLAFENIQQYDKQVFFYHFSIFAFAGLTGLLSKNFVRYYKLDRRHKFMRFQNSWHYLFTGEFFDFPKAAYDLINDDVEHIEYVYIDVLTETSAGSMVYEGILVDYQLSAEKGLEYIMLKETFRKFLKNPDDKPKTLTPELSSQAEASINEFNLRASGFSDEYKIPGHIIIIPIQQIKNINFSYYRIASAGTDEYKVIRIS